MLSTMKQIDYLLIEQSLVYHVKYLDYSIWIGYSRLVEHANLMICQLRRKAIARTSACF